LGKEADRREEKEVCTGVKSRVRQKSETVGGKKKKKKTRREKRNRQGREKRNTSTTKRGRGDDRDRKREERRKYVIVSKGEESEDREGKPGESKSRQARFSPRE